MTSGTLRWGYWLAIGLLCTGHFLFLGCAARISLPPARVPTGGFEPGSFKQQGIASWYGPKFHGRETANGEVYNMYELTAAHRYVPFGTKIAVTNLNNGRKVHVRINDRGPFVKNRIIDLSYAAAQRLDMIGTGTAPVRLTVHTPAPSAGQTQGSFYIQTGSFHELDNAETMYSRLIERGYTGTRIMNIEFKGQKYWRVQAGMFHTMEAAQKALKRLQNDIPASFIVAD